MMILFTEPWTLIGKWIYKEVAATACPLTTDDKGVRGEIGNIAHILNIIGYI